VTKVSHEHSSHLKKAHKVVVNMEDVKLSENSAEEEEPGRPSGAILSLALGKQYSLNLSMFSYCKSKFPMHTHKNKE
jgi:hypothetical protein